MRISQYFRRMYYRLFGPFIATRRYGWREKENKKAQSEPYRVEVAFRSLEKELHNIKYPQNEFNKLMGMLLSDIELFQHIALRFRKDRSLLSAISSEDQFLHRIDPDRRSYPVHPIEKKNNSSIKIDTQSLFIFGMILVNRISLLLKLYLPDRSSDTSRNMYAKIGGLYFELNRSEPPLSPLGDKFRQKFSMNLKWLYAVLRFYRNEFIEHLDRGYQQGMNYGFYQEDFALTSYKWDYGDQDDKKVEEFRKVLLSRGIKISERTGHRSLVNRYYIQQVFNNIEVIPDDLLKRALDLIEDIGGNSPQPEQIISKVEDYIEGTLLFMKDEIGNSELSKYRSS